MSLDAASRFVSVGGLRLHYLAWGRPEAPALILLHDLAESADVWRPVVPGLVSHFYTVAVDLRGHGDSDWSDTYSPQEQGDDIGELIETLRLAPAAVMGTGMGGRAAALLAARQEHRLSRAVLVETGVHMYLPPEREADEAVLAMARVYDSPEEYLQRWQELRRQLGLRRDATPPGPEEVAVARRLLRPLLGDGLAPKCDLDGYQRYRAWSPGERVVSYHEEFHEITAPVLLVRGADSPVFTPDEVQATLASIHRCRLVEVPDARHDVLADNPRGLLDAVLPFLLGKG